MQAQLAYWMKRHVAQGSALYFTEFSKNDKQTNEFPLYNTHNKNIYHKRDIPRSKRDLEDKP